MKLDPGTQLRHRLEHLARERPPSLQAELSVLRADAQKLGIGAEIEQALPRLFPDLFQRGGRALSSASTTAFPVTEGGRGVGGTIGLLRPGIHFSGVGVARFLPMSDVTALAKAGKPPPPGLLILDTNLGDVEKTAHPGWAVATIDHHGPVHGKGKGRGTNSTTQLLDRFEQALAAADVAVARRQPAFTGALVAIEKAAKHHGIFATTADKERAAAALIGLSLQHISSDNVGDGLSWPVWMAKNQARVLLDPGLRALIREATVFEDFAVFGGNYLKGVADVADLPHAVKLQSALFAVYDEALAAAGVIGTDRVPPEQAGAVADRVGAAIDALLADPRAVDAGAHAFFFQVGMALTTVEEHALVKDATLTDADGRLLMPVFDVTKLPEALGTFGRWAVPPLFSEHPLQMTVNENGDGRRTAILAIPDERSLPSGRGLLGLLDTLNALERQKTPPGQPVASWFGRDTVLLPSAPGSLLSPVEIADVVARSGLLSS